jgi:hypothetical protein
VLEEVAEAHALVVHYQMLLSMGLAEVDMLPVDLAVMDTLVQ